MFPAERAATQLEELNSARIANVKTPVVWSGLRVSLGRLDQIFAQQDVSVHGEIPLEALPALGPTLFAGKKSLTDTVSAIAGKPIISIDSLRGSTLQIGHKAHILFYEAKVDGDNYYFVTYLSREAKQTAVGKEAEEDFNNLRMLSRQFRERLTDEAQSQYSVVEPIVLDYVTYNKKKYPFFTMPFLPLGEIWSDIIPVQNSSEILTTIPFIHYGGEYSKDMEAVNAQQDKDARAAATSHPNWKTGKLNGIMIEGEQWLKQRDDILRGNALIHLISGSFPRQHQLNAGDWMGEITEDRMSKLCLITVRGGFDKPLTKQEFFTRMQDMTDVAFFTGFHIQTFNGVSSDDLERIYEEAKGLLR